MATQVIKTTFQLRRGQSEAWARVNPVLAAGEPGFELDTNRLKIGNGITAWNKLPYLASDSYSISSDGRSVVMNESNEVTLYGYDNALSGQIPQKGEDGYLKWIGIEEDKPLSEQEILDALN